MPIRSVRAWSMVNALLCCTVCRVLAHAAAAFQISWLARASAVTSDSNTLIVRLRALHGAPAKQRRTLQAFATRLALHIVVSTHLVSNQARGLAIDVVEAVVARIVRVAPATSWRGILEIRPTTCTAVSMLAHLAIEIIWLVLSRLLFMALVADWAAERRAFQAINSSTTTRHVWALFLCRRDWPAAIRWKHRIRHVSCAGIKGELLKITCGFAEKIMALRCGERNEGENESSKNSPHCVSVGTATKEFEK